MIARLRKKKMRKIDAKNIPFEYKAFASDVEGLLMSGLQFNKAAMEALDAYLWTRRSVTVKKRMNAYIWGSPGRSKTTLLWHAFGAFQSAPQEDEWFKIVGASTAVGPVAEWSPICAPVVKFLRFDDLCDADHMVRNSYKPSDVHHDVVSASRSAEVLLLDDVGVEWSENPARAKSMLKQLLDYRHSNGLITMSTTNLSPEQFKEIFGEALASRMFFNTLVLDLSGPDMRKLSEHDATSLGVQP